MRIIDYSIQLAEEIMSKFPTKECNYISIRSDDDKFIKYKDDNIKIVKGKNTKAMVVTIYNPLTTASSNPIIYVDDNGECYRCHGERIYFQIYAETLLNKDEKTKIRDKNKEELIRELAVYSRIIDSGKFGSKGAD